MSVVSAVGRARAFCAEHLGQQMTVVAVGRREDGWRVVLEVVVDSEYQRQRAQRDLLATYEILLDPDLDVVSFERKELRERGTPSSNA